MHQMQEVIRWLYTAMIRPAGTRPRAGSLHPGGLVRELSECRTKLR